MCDSCDFTRRRSAKNKILATILLIVTLMVLFDRKTDGLRDEISPDIKK